MKKYEAVPKVYFKEKNECLSKQECNHRSGKPKKVSRLNYLFFFVLPHMF